MDERALDEKGRVRIDKLRPFVYCPVIHVYRSAGGKLGKFGFSKNKARRGE